MELKDSQMPNYSAVSHPGIIMRSSDIRSRIRMNATDIRASVDRIVKLLDDIKTEKLEQAIIDYNRVLALLKKPRAVNSAAYKHIIECSTTPAECHE